MFRAFRELHRRHVFRGAGYYLLGAWVALQVADVIVEPAGLPQWTMTALLYLILAGFPLAMYIGWRYDFTEHGIVRTQKVSDREIDATDLSLKKSDYLILASLVVVTGLVIYQFLPNIRQVGQQPQQPTVVKASVLSNSIAVLPFADLSQEKDQQYLGDGISDTVMHVLSQVGGLMVTARTSSFSFKHTSLNVREIAEILRVANVLEGSVQKAGNEVRIIARLIDAENGMELWSGYFDRELEGIFDIQDEIAREVVAALKIAVLDGDQGHPQARYQPKLASFEQLIRGRAELDKGTMAARSAAKAHFEKAIELDPDFAEPYVDLSAAYSMSSFNSTMGQQESAELRRPLIEKALDLDPLLAAAHTALGYLLRDEGKVIQSTESFLRAIEIRPSFAAAYAGLGSNSFRAGEFEQSLVYHKKAAELDPQENQFQLFLANAYWQLAQSEKALGILRDSIRRNPKPGNYGMMVGLLMQLGRLGEAMKFQQATYQMDTANLNARKHVCEMYYQMWDIDAYSSCIKAFIEENPDDLEVRQKQAGFNSDFDEAVRLGRQLVEGSPNMQFRKQQVVYWLSYAHRWQEVIDIVNEIKPGLFQNPPKVQAWDMFMAIPLVQALNETGQSEQGVAVATAGLDFMTRQRKLQAGAEIIGIEDAQFYALLGERDLMLKSLGVAINNGWMFNSYIINDAPGFEAYQDDPDFQALVDRQAASVQKQRDWYEAHKDEPLF